MEQKMIAPLIIGALIIGGGSFYGGMRYEQSTISSANAARASDFRAGRGAGGFAGGPMGGRGGAGGGAGFTAGSVVSKDNQSITLKLRDGGSKIIFFSSSTNIGKMAQGTIDDIATGTEVTANGAANQDGSIAASMIQIRPPQPAQPTQPTQQK